MYKRNWLFLFFWERGSHSVTQAGEQWQVQVIRETSVSPIARILRACHCAWLIFIFLVEMGFHHVDQHGLNLLTLWSTRLGLPKCWDHRRELGLPHPAAYGAFDWRESFAFDWKVLYKSVKPRWSIISGCLCSPTCGWLIFWKRSLSFIFSF